MVSIIWLLFGHLVSHDAYWMAVAIQGEGCHLVNEESAWLMGDTILNRLDAGLCSTIEQCVKDAYWGWPNGEKWLTEDTYHLAIDILSQRHRRNRQQIYFAFSQEDVARKDIPIKNAISQCSPSWCLHFYGRWPWD